MKNILACLVFLVLAFSAHAQQPFICTLPDSPSGQQSSSAPSSGTCSIDFSTYDVSSPFTIYINLIFKDGPNGENFTPDSAVLIGHRLIDIANEQLAGMGISNRAGPGGMTPSVISNAKWKYKIYTEGLPGDDLGGIWLGNNPNSSMYNDKVALIEISNEHISPECFKGTAGIGNLSGITMNSVYNCHYEYWGLGVFARVVNHEFGHAMGLQHVTWCNNQCRFVDVDPEAHCLPQCPNFAKCDCPNPTRIQCFPGGNHTCSVPMNPPPSYTDRCSFDSSNNIMSQAVNLLPFTNTRLPDALTPCQWEIVQNYILTTSYQVTSWADNCQEIDSDYSIPSGTTVTWTSLVNINRNIIVEKGAILNINCEVRFAQGTGIIVRQGGTLNVNGAKLTNLCKEMPWNGIKVEGDPLQSQYSPGQHGRAYIKPGSIVENAKEAVRLIDGGMVFTNGATYLNNGTGIVYRPYSNFWPFGSQMGQPRDHIGSIQNCLFSWDGTFAGALPINAGIELESVRGVNISGCSFVNTRPISNPAGNNAYGYGVKATDAKFKVTSMAMGPVGTPSDPPPAYDHTEFKGLGYGVYVGTALSGSNGTPGVSDDFVNVPYTVQQATFSECIYGIHNRFVSQGTIVGNTFNMGKLPPANPYSGTTPYTNAQYGVFIENGANGFELQENQFIKEENNVEYAYGSYCQNLGDFNNKIRRNTYTNVEAGNLADENNAVAGVIPRGLYYLCNTNTNQNHDFYVYPGGDIRRNQGMENGTSFIAAGNIFTLANAPMGDFENNGPQVRYYTNQSTEEPLHFFGLQNPFPFGQVNICVSDYCLPPCHEKGDFDALKSEYGTTKDKYLFALSDLQSAQSSGNATLADQKANLAAGYRLRMDELANTLSLHMAFDSTTYSIDSVRVWWQRMDSPVSDMVVARDLLAKGQSVTAFSTLDAIPTKYNFSDGDLDDLNDYRAIMQIVQGESAGELAASKVQQLLPYANNGKGISAAWAKNILTLNGYHFPPLPKPLGRSSDRSQKEEAKVQKPDTYQVSPNPAKDQVRFARVDKQSVSGMFIIVTDTNGRIIWQSSTDTHNANVILWQTGDTPDGIYFYTIRDTNGIVQSGRISIIK